MTSGTELSPQMQRHGIKLSDPVVMTVGRR